MSIRSLKKFKRRTVKTSFVTALILSFLVVIPVTHGTVQAADTSAEIAIQVENESVTMEEFNAEVEQKLQRLKSRLQQSKQMPDSEKPSEAMLRKQMKQRVTRQVTNQLLLQVHAKKQGFNVSDQEIQTEWDNLVKRYNTEEKLETAIREQGRTSRGVRSDIENAIRVRKLLDENTKDITVSDTEVRSFYEKNKQQFGDRSYSDLKERIRNHLKQQKTRKAVQKLVSELREKYEVNVNV